MMRAKRSRAETVHAWMERIERFRKNQGSRSEFCRREGSTLTGLSYWLNRQADSARPLPESIISNDY
jgi:hypothetical protein